VRWTRYTSFRSPVPPALGMDVLGEMGVLTSHPWLALVPAALFAALFAISKNRIIYIAQWSWLGYVLYEYGIKLGIVCSGDCSIRIDLFVIYPALILVSFAALGALIITVLRKNYA